LKGDFSRREKQLSFRDFIEDVKGVLFAMKK
jgi:hypothetical protein